MHKLFYLLKLIRFNNLLITAVIQIFIKLYLVNAYLSNSALSNINFSIYLIALISIIAGGYIINDIYDIEIDKINRPDSRIVEQKIKKENAKLLYYGLNMIGVFSGFYASNQIGKTWYGIIFIFFIFSLWKYSSHYKGSFLIGNFQIAFLTSLSIINIIIFDLIPIGIQTQDGSKIIAYIIFSYAAFAFLTTLIREIIKDLEDIEGDKKIGLNTLAINYGIAKTKNIITLLIIITIIGIAYFQYFQYSVLNSIFSVTLLYWGVNTISVLYTILVQIMLIILLVIINRANTVSEFHFSSIICKIIMLIGGTSIPLFYCLHIN